MALPKFLASIQHDTQELQNRPKNAPKEVPAETNKSELSESQPKPISPEEAKQLRLANLYSRIYDNPCAETLKLITKPDQTFEIVKAVLQADGLVLNDVYKRLVTYELCLIAVKQNGLALECVVNKYPVFLSDEIIEEAVKSNGLAIEFVSLDKISKKLARLAICQPINEKYRELYKYPIAFVPPQLIDYELSVESIKNAPLSLRHIPKDYMTRALMLQAVKDDGRALGCIPEEYKTKDLVKIAVSSDPYNIQFVPLKLRTETICDRAFQNNPLVLKWVPEKYITVEMCLATIAASDLEDVTKRFEIEWIPYSLRKDITIFDALIEKYGARYILEWNEMLLFRRKKYGRYACKDIPLPECILSHIYNAISNNYQDDPWIIEFLPEHAISKEMCMAAIHTPELESSTKHFQIGWIPRALWSDKEILEALIEKYGQEKIESWNDGLLMKHSALIPKFHISEVEPPASPSNAYLIPDNNKEVQLYELALQGGESALKNYYISDIHLEHQLKAVMENDNTTYQDLYDAIDNKIKEMLANIRFDDTTGYILVAGDVGHSKELVSLFYDRLKRFWYRPIIAVLGNHELWDDLPEQSRPIDIITSDYIGRIKANPKNYPSWSRDIFLLQNALYINYKNEQHKVIGEQKLLSYSDEELRELCSKSSFIVLGGIGFTGLNKKYNATKGYYRTTVTSLEKDRELSKRFEELHEKLRRCAGDMQIVVLTHTSVSDWLSSATNPNWIYINGHTHRNSIIRNHDGTTVLSDNQIGYTPRNWKLNLFTVSGWYDPFKYWTDGIHQITSDQYQEFNQGRGISSNGCGYPGVLYMLKKSEMYMFVLKSKTSLCLLVGGQRNRLDKDDPQYYYRNMERFVQKIIESTHHYQDALRAISKEVRTIGGEGTIHGFIVDIDYFNHIYLDRETGEIVLYYAHDMNSRLVYPDLLSLIKSRVPQLVDRTVNAHSCGQIPLLSQFAIESNTNNGLTLSSTKPRLMLGTDIYKPSLVMKKIQYIFEKNVVRIWKEDIATSDVVSEVKQIQ